jgi:uncharacterized protein with GYD domain
MSNRGEHPLDLVLAALVQGQLDRGGAEQTGPGGRGAAVLEVDPSAEPRERIVRRPAFDLCLVHLLDAVARMGEAVCQVAVVGEEQGAGRVGVEAADRHDPRRVVDELDDGAAALRVAGRRDRCSGLVQEDVGERLPFERASVELDAVAGADEGVELARLAVDRDAPGLDQLVGAAPGGDPGTREIGIQPHTRHYSGAVPHYVSLMRWTSQGVAGLPAWRERVEEGERIIQEAGGELIGVYVTLGRYDVVEIFVAPDDDTAAEILLKLQRHGAEHTETLRAFTREEAEAIIRRL